MGWTQFWNLSLSSSKSKGDRKSGDRRSCCERRLSQLWSWLYNELRLRSQLLCAAFLPVAQPAADHTERCRDASFADHDSEQKTAFVKKKHCDDFCKVRKSYAAHWSHLGSASPWCRKSGMAFPLESEPFEQLLIRLTRLAFLFHACHRKNVDCIEISGNCDALVQCGRWEIQPSDRNETSSPEISWSKSMFLTVERHQNLDRPSQKMSKEKLAHTSAMRLWNFVGRVWYSH